MVDYLSGPVNPDVILMDIEMPFMDGIEATSIIHQKHPGVKIIMLTVFDDDENIFNAISAGANGYLLKDENPEALYNGIHSILKGGAPMSPSIALKALDILRDPDRIEKETSDFDLTRREKEILEQLSTGLSYNQIADNLVISSGTVRKHIENIYRKLQVHNKVEALDVARKNKIL